MNMTMDLQILLFLQKIREAMGTFGNVFFELCSSSVLIALYGCVGIYAMVKGERRKGYRILLSFILAECMVWLVKCTFCVPRPWLRCDLLHPTAKALKGATGHSFPSGHSAAVGSLLLGIDKSYSSHRKWFSMLCYVLMGLTMLSRMMLSVHTPQDVLVGLLIALAVSRLVEVILDGAEKDTLNTEQVLGITLALSGAMALYFWFKPYPDGIDEASLKDAIRVCGMLAGCGCGWYCEEKQHDHLGMKYTWITGGILALLAGIMTLIPAFYMFEKAALITFAVFVPFVMRPAVLRILLHVQDRNEL